MDIGQTVPSTLMPKGQTLMVDAQQMEHGGLEVVNMHGILHNIIAEIIRLAIGDPGFYAPSGHPYSKTSRMVVTSVIIGG